MHVIDERCVGKSDISPSRHALEPEFDPEKTDGRGEVRGCGILAHPGASGRIVKVPRAALTLSRARSKKYQFPICV